MAWGLGTSVLNHCNRAVEKESCSIMDIDFQFYKMKSSRDLFHNNGNILNITIICTVERGKDGKFHAMCFLPQ